MSLSPKEQITKTRISLSRKYPFFGYLAMYLKPVITNKIETACVQLDGTLKVNPKFFSELDDAEKEAVIAHEVMHLALEHIQRSKGKEPKLRNITDDAVNNAILQKSGFKLPRGAIVPDYNDVFRCAIVTENGYKTVEIPDCSKKTSDEIYDILYALYKKHNGTGWKLSNNARPLDEHATAPKDDNGNTSQKMKQQAEIWAKRVKEALEYARQRGKMPAGLDRLIDKIYASRIPWRQLLYKFLIKYLPIDYTYARPHKKSYSLKTYLPFIKREGINIVVSIDTSGSISDEELKDALSEVVGIVRSVRNSKMTVIYSDAKVQRVETYHCPTVHDILKSKPKGGGGTDHRPVFKYIEKNCQDASVIVAFTDLWTVFPDKFNKPTIWINFDASNAKKPPFGTVINYSKRG